MDSSTSAVDSQDLFIAYCASAEMCCHLILEWPLPINVFDLFTEFGNTTNGLTLPCGAGTFTAIAFSTDRGLGDRGVLMLTTPGTDSTKRAVWFTFLYIFVSIIAVFAHAEDVKHIGCCVKGVLKWPGSTSKWDSMDLQYPKYCVDYCESKNFASKRLSSCNWFLQR